VTGYQLTKFVAAQAVRKQMVNPPTPLPIFRLAEAMLNFAEAKEAELGALTQVWINLSGNCAAVLVCRA